MNDSNQNTENSEVSVNRRNFLSAAGAVPISQMGPVDTLLNELDTKAETHFIEAALEFEVLNDEITPGYREGPYRYNAVRDKNAFFALYRLNPQDFDKLVASETVTFGLESFKTGNATFANDGLNVLPTLASDTPRLTRYLRLNQWNNAPKYSVRSLEDASTVVETAEKTVEVGSDTARRIELDTRRIPTSRIPGYENSDGVRVNPRLEVRNYGRMQIYDVRNRTWKR